MVGDLAPRGASCHATVSVTRFRARTRVVPVSRPPPICFAVVLALAGTDAWAQDDAMQAAREAVVRAMDMSVSSFCFQAPETDQTAITVQVEHLPANALMSEAGAATPAQPVRIGSYAYEGKGVRITSDDPRFADLRIDPVLAVPRLSSGERLVTWNLVGATGGGQCRLALTPDAPPARHRSQLANEVGAQARLTGYRAGASWPFGTERFVGLMHPEGRGNRTLIVTFASGPDHKTRVEADVPLAIQSIQTSPPIHGGPWSLLLIGLQADGSVVQAVLQTEPPA